MARQFVNIIGVSKFGNGRESLNLSARIMRMWNLPSFNNVNMIGSIEMILMDDQCDKIHCTVRKPLVSRFHNMLVEGRCYNFHNLVTIPNIGAYRTTSHSAKCGFHLRTTVSPVDRPSIPLDGITPTAFKDILSDSLNADYLINVVGLLTGMSQPKDYERDGKTGKMVVIELTSKNEKVECALFGEYVEQMCALVRGSPLDLPVVVLQLVKLKSFRGKVGLQNVMWATKIMLNPNIESAVKFKDSISTEGLPTAHNINIFSEIPKVSLEDDFMKNHPKASIDFLTANEQSGTYIIMGTMNSIVEDGPWWYPACRCGRSVIPDSGIYFCDFCDTHVFSVSPRFKLMLEVEDPTGTAIFVLFEKDCGALFKKTYAEIFAEHMRNPENVRNNVYPELFTGLCSKKMLFKIEPKAISPNRYNGTFCVKRVCDESDILSMFCLDGADRTPTKATFTPSFTTPSFTDSMGLEEICTGMCSNTTGKKMIRHTGISVISHVDNEVVPDSVLAHDEISLNAGRSSLIGNGTITPAKQNLEAEFNEVVTGNSKIDKMKSIKVEE